MFCELTVKVFYDSQSPTGLILSVMRPEEPKQPAANCLSSFQLRSRT